MGIENGPRRASIKNRRHYEFLNEFDNFYDESLLVYEGRFNQFGGPEDLLLRHEQNGRLGCNITFVGGNTEFVTEDRIAELKWTVE